MDTPTTIVITHGFCTDGSAGAWVVREATGTRSTRYVYARYRDLTRDLAPFTPDDLAGKDVYIVDYMYPYDTIANLRYKSLTIIDHHASAKDDCARCAALSNTRVFFDETYSAATLAWVSLIGTEIPWWLRYVQDRDLYTFSLPYSREVTDGMYNQGYRTFAKFDELHAFGDDERASFIEKCKVVGGEGSVANEGKTRLVRSGAGSAYLRTFLGYRVYVVQTPVLVSETAEHLYTTYGERCDFVVALQYNFAEKFWHARLRSSLRSPLDLGQIAKAAATEDLSGGGHPHSAAFSYRGDILPLFGDAE